MAKLAIFASISTIVVSLGLASLTTTISQSSVRPASTRDVSTTWLAIVPQSVKAGQKALMLGGLTETAVAGQGTPAS